MKKYSRRKFLRTASAASVLAYCLYPLNKLLSAPLDRSRQTPTWQELIEHARWCPSVHNLQPHKIRILSPTEAELHYDGSRLLQAADPNAIFATVALGVFIEHLSIVAKGYGFKIENQQITAPIGDTRNGIHPFTQLTLIPNDEKEELTKELIHQRRTSRIPYETRAIDPSVLFNIKKEAALYDHDFKWSTETQIVKEIIALNQHVLFEDLQSAANRNELDRLFRYTKEDAQLKKDGLWAHCMGFPGALVKSVFHHHERWQKGFRKELLARYYHHSFHGTTTICWMSGPFDSPEDWINAGKALARNWLLFTKEKIYLHPMGSLITNPTANEKINQLFTPAAGLKNWMIFRAGYSKEPARSFRLSTEEILIP